MPQQVHPRKCYIGLGSNLQDPAAQITQAFDELARLPRTRLLRRSSLYLSAPMGEPDQPEFVNAVALLETELSPPHLLEALLAIEARHRRVRGEPNGPRTLDLDLLLVGDDVIHLPQLDVPHPRMHERAFVLCPLAELDPEALIPGQPPLRELLATVSDQRVTRIGAHP
ncbi:MAG TPA: 2-amino-4-hydroxy-6-hydroxymethyldihydropteridine diphosphokinase [Burkholderiales bacterium]|nr:2-amino-4-hydroxy-6-hydroxymethyldihydropteridine diphosphokinase [Burkholderiales bacterium]